MNPALDAEHHRRLLEGGRLRAGLTVEDLWLRYFGLGGTADVVATEAYLRGLGTLPNHERDMLAHALNEGLAELQAPDRMPYSFD